MIWCRGPRVGKKVGLHMSEFRTLKDIEVVIEKLTTQEGAE